MNQNGHKEPEPSCAVPDCPGKVHEESKHNMCWKHSEMFDFLLFAITRINVNGVPFGIMAEATRVVMAQMHMAKRQQTVGVNGPGGLILPR